MHIPRVQTPSTQDGSEGGTIRNHRQPEDRLHFGMQPPYESEHTCGKTRETSQSNCELPNPPESAEKSVQVNFKTAGIQPVRSDGGSLTPKRLKTVSSPGDTSLTLGPKT